MKQVRQVSKFVSWRIRGSSSCCRLIESQAGPPLTPSFYTYALCVLRALFPVLLCSVVCTCAKANYVRTCAVESTGSTACPTVALAAARLRLAAACVRKSVTGQAQLGCSDARGAHAAANAAPARVVRAVQPRQPVQAGGAAAARAPARSLQPRGGGVATRAACARRRAARARRRAACVRALPGHRAGAADDAAEHKVRRTGRPHTGHAAARI